MTAGDAAEREEPRAPRGRARVGLVIALLTLNAGWIDALAFLSLGRIFASFLSGNFVFIGLGAAQGDRALMGHALVAVVAAFAGVLLGSSCLEARERPSASAWTDGAVLALGIEWLLLLGFAVVWRAAGDPTGHPDAQLLLLSLAALGMGIQGAVVDSFDVRGAVANALTGTVIVLGRRMVGGLRRRSRASPEGVSLVVLPLLYVLSATCVVLTAASGLPPVVPVLIVTAAIGALARPLARRSSGGPRVPASRDDVRAAARER